MKRMTGMAALVVGAFCLAAAQAQAPQGQPPPPTPQQRVAMLKQWLQASQAQLRAYEWIETTVIAKGGEEKSRKQNRCYYGTDGKLQKVLVSASESESGGPPGVLIPGKILKRAGQKKKEDLVEYMQSAGELVKSYIPPDPQRIQQSVNAGKFSLDMVQPGVRGRLNFRDYQKSGDVLSVDIELPTNRLLGMGVSSYLEDAKDAVKLDVGMGVLPDGTIHTAKTTLTAAAKDIVVTIENTGYRRMGN